MLTLRLTVWAMILCGTSLAAAEQVVVSVPDMHCAGCANTIRESFRKLPHVQRVAFSFPAKTITAHTDRPGQLTDAEIRTAVAKLNYKLAKITRSNDSK